MANESIDANNELVLAKWKIDQYERLLGRFELEAEQRQLKWAMQLIPLVSNSNWFINFIFTI